MPNPTTKQELLAAMADGYAQLNEQIAKMSEAEHTAPFTFAADPKKSSKTTILYNIYNSLSYLCIQ